MACNAQRVYAAERQFVTKGWWRQDGAGLHEQPASHGIARGAE
jgi:hypothetical protein